MVLRGCGRAWALPARLNGESRYCVTVIDTVNSWVAAPPPDEALTTTEYVPRGVPVEVLALLPLIALQPRLPPRQAAKTMA